MHFEGWRANADAMGELASLVVSGEVDGRKPAEPRVSLLVTLFSFYAVLISGRNENACGKEAFFYCCRFDQQSIHDKHLKCHYMCIHFACGAK